MKPVYTLLICCLVFCALIVFIVVHKTPQKAQERTVFPISAEEVTEDFDYEALKALNGGSIDINYDPQTGFPKQINGIFSTKSIETAEDALSAMLCVRTFMHIQENQFVCLETNCSDDGINSFVFAQAYRGLVVEKSIFRVTAAKDGTPVSLSGIYRSGIDIDITPSVSYREGAESVSLAPKTHIAQYQLVVYENKGEFLLSWKYYIDAKDPLERKYIYIDAHTGQLIAIAPTAIA